MKKDISPERERFQSTVLTVLVTASVVILLLTRHISPQMLLIAGAVSAFFGAVVGYLRAATTGGVGLGMLFCLALLTPARTATNPPWSSLAALIALFVLSFTATRFGRSRKETQGLAESRRGRQASQIAANLGAAAIFAAAGSHVGCIAALAEAAADTISSEIGQALGGRVRLLTTLRIVPAGTNGGVTLPGTLAGVSAGLAVTWIGAPPNLRQGVAILAAATTGLLFDSFLGATVERKGWLGNDLVNFSSTVFAAALAILLTV